MATLATLAQKNAFGKLDSGGLLGYYARGLIEEEIAACVLT